MGRSFLRPVSQLSQRSMSNVKSKLRFDGQTAIITGAGRGLGKEYALLLGRRGANVLVNDFGGARSGEMTQEDDKNSVANQVVEEIESNGGCAIANYESISDEEGSRRLVDSALQKFGRIDILINNAGILRDKSFAKMTIEDWDQVHQVHLRGSFLMSKACWPRFKSQKYGKIIMTGSTSGLFGNFGQANYSAAKMGLVGLSNTLAVEGRKDNIHCNTIIPLAASRLTHDILPPDFAAKLEPKYIAPLVAYLCHKDCDETGAIFEAAGQWYGRYKLNRSKGKFLPNICDDDNAIEHIVGNWKAITTVDEHSKTLDSFGDHLSELLNSIENSK